MFFLDVKSSLARCAALNLILLSALALAFPGVADETPAASAVAAPPQPANPVGTGEPAAAAAPSSEAIDPASLPAASPAGRQKATPTPTPPEAMAAVQAAAGGSSGNPDAGHAFGYDAFRSGGELISEGPVDDSYLISPGDEIVVSLWGQLVETLNLTVTPEGFIDLPDQGGRIQTNGVSLKDLRPRVMQALSLIYAAYIDPLDSSKSKAFVDVQLGKLRKLSIFVVGEVNKPGAFNVSPGVANVINLLHNAGGLRDSGSLRNIKIRRNSGKIDSIDLYGFLLTGEIDFSAIRLGPGDYIVVPLKEKSVTIEGEVNRPHAYEIVGNEGVRDLVRYAGGFTPDAYLKRVQIHRYEVNRGGVLVDLDLDILSTQPEANPPLMNGDKLSVGKNIQVRKNSVSIHGDGITRAGTYEWTPGMTLNDLVEKGEGLREYAFLGRADLIRTESDFSRKLSVLSLNELYRRGDDGKITFTANAEKNLPLKEMDEVIIQSSPGMTGANQFVTLEGKVREPGRFALAKNMSLYDVIFARGGFQDDALRKSTFMDTAHIFRTIPGLVGKKIIPFNLGALLSGEASANLPLEENDVVHIYSYDDVRVHRQVSIEGLVKNPGEYDMVEGLTLEDLIVMAGGLLPESFKAEAAIARSEREVPLTDGDLSALTMMSVPVDVRNFIKLPAEQRTLLKPDDRITIRSVPGWERVGVIRVRGQVRAPGNYALPPGIERLSSVIKRAGGLTGDALAEGAYVQRSLGIIKLEERNGKNYRDVTINLPAALANPGGTDDIVIEPQDGIFIPRNSGVIEVRGAVNRELTLQHKSGRTLGDYIALCGGYMGKADPAEVKVYGPNKAAIALSVTAGTGKSKGKSLAALVIPPGSVIEVPFLHENERLLTVEVMGAVNHPVMIQHMEGAPLGYYLNLSGGFTQAADIDGMSVLAPDGSLLKKQGNQTFNPVIKGGSQVMIPVKPALDAGVK